jgi:hypothetical protein
MTKARDLANLGNKTSLDEINDAYDAGALSNRNMFHNSEMKVAQRVSYPSTQPAVSYPGYYTVDRWYNHISGVNSRGVCTISQAQDAPTGFRNSLKIAVTTADTSLDAWAEYGINQRFEGQDLQRLCKGTSSAKEVTISFWVKSSLTGTYILEMLDDDNGSRHINKSYTINSANTWEYKSITFAGDTSGVLDNDNAKSMTVSWHLAGGSNFQGGGLQTSWGSLAQTKRQDGQVNFFANTGNTFQLTACQMEVGDTATPFEHRSYGDELAKCQRYYQKFHDPSSAISQIMLIGLSSTYTQFSWWPPVEMRVKPTVGVTDTSPYWESHPWYAVGTSLTITQVSNAHVSRYGGEIAVVGNWNPAPVRGTNYTITGEVFYWDAEL